MPKYAISPEGADELNKLAAKILACVSDTLDKGSALSKLIDSLDESLGVFSEDIRKVIHSNYHTVRLHWNEIGKVCASLNSKANEIMTLYQTGLLGADIDVGPSPSARIDAQGTGNGDVPSPGHSTLPAIQNEHKKFIPNYEDAITAVQKDIMAGSGRTISKEEAAEMLAAIKLYSGMEGYKPIRKAYRPNFFTTQKDIDALHSLDDYIKLSPKWEGQLFRGINVSQNVANKMLSEPYVDMLGPASWSGDQNIAERFSRGKKDVQIIFVLDKNKSGASISHLGTFDGNESEVTSPSGILYYIDNIKNRSINGKNILIVDVHE